MAIPPSHTPEPRPSPASGPARGAASLGREAQVDLPEGDSLSPVELLTVEQGEAARREDWLATEEALEIRVSGTAPVITMRTPGHDLELAAGLLVSEGLIRQREEIAVLRRLSDDAVGVMLKSLTDAKAALLRRSSLSNSACGVCGKDKLNLEPMRALPALPPGPSVRSEVLWELPARLRAAQGVFERTGGLHAAALFDSEGRLRVVREDVGRHNAMDKLCGWALLEGRLPLHDQVVLLSGRASFELLQKCVMARVPIVCAISAPSSYAVRLAREFGITLVGFLRGERFNVYSAPERIVPRSKASVGAVAT